VVIINGKEKASMAEPVIMYVAALAIWGVYFWGIVWQINETAKIRERDGPEAAALYADAFRIRWDHDD
jgi:hypothetical protein